MPSLKEKRRGINIFQQLLKQLGIKMNIDFGRLIINDSRALVFILSGSGLSAESGIPTFRGKDGLWKNWYPSEIASDTALKERPEDVFEFYNFRIGKAIDCLPNAAHTSIAQFQQAVKDYCDVVHVTQNVDNLNELAGSPSVFHLHGDFQSSLCSQCKNTFPRLGLYKKNNVCPVCGASGYSVRPNVVLFGEMPYGLDWITSYLKKACVFMSVGTSGAVYPAANFVLDTEAAIRINFDIETGKRRNASFTHEITGPCSQTLPPVLEALKEELSSRFKEQKNK